MSTSPGPVVVLHAQHISGHISLCESGNMQLLHPQVQLLRLGQHRHHTGTISWQPGALPMAEAWLSVCSANRLHSSSTHQAKSLNSDPVATRQAALVARQPGGCDLDRSVTIRPAQLQCFNPEGLRPSKARNSLAAAGAGAEQEEEKPSYGCELTTDQWNAWDFDPLRLTRLKVGPSQRSSVLALIP